MSESVMFLGKSCKTMQDIFLQLKSFGLVLTKKHRDAWQSDRLHYQFFIKNREHETIEEESINFFVNNFKEKLVERKKEILEYSPLSENSIIDSYLKILKEYDSPNFGIRYKFIDENDKFLGIVIGGVEKNDRINIISSEYMFDLYFRKDFLEFDVFNKTIKNYYLQITNDEFYKNCVCGDEDISNFFGREELEDQINSIIVEHISCLYDNVYIYNFTCDPDYMDLNSIDEHSIEFFVSFNNDSTELEIAVFEEYR